MGVSIASAVHDRGGHFNGVAAVSISLKKFGDILSSVQSSIGEESLVLHEDGEIIYAIPRTEELAGKNLIGGVAFTQHLTSGQMMTRHLNVTKNTRREMAAVFLNVPNTPLIVVASRPYSDMIAPWVQSTLIKAISYLVLAGILLFLTGFAVRRQKDLARQDANFRTVSDFAHDWESWRTPEGNYRYISPSCERITGYTKEEFLADDTLMEKIILPDDLPVWHQHVMTLAMKHGCEEIIFRIRRRDGEVRWIEHACNPVTGDDGHYQGQRSSNRDITVRQVISQELADRNRLQEAIHIVQEQFIREPDSIIMFDKLLQHILELTGSKFGLIGDVLQDEEEHDFLKCFAFTNVAWNGETRRFYEEHKAKDFVFKKLDNLFGHVITHRTTVIANDPANDPRSTGMPPGHPKLDAFLGVPIWYGDRLVGEIGLANRPGGYDQTLVDFIQPILETCGQIIVARWEREARLQADEALRQSQERLSIAAEAGIVGVWDWDIPNNKLIWDKVMYRHLGIREEDFCGAYESWFNAIHPDDKADSEEGIQAALRGEHPFDKEFRVIWPDSSIHHIKAVSRTIFDDEGKPLRMIGVNYDLTEQKQKEEAIRTLAYYDTLTNLPNRRLLIDRLDRDLTHARRFKRSMAIMFLDLDHFKEVNDTHGHDIGDLLLQEVATRLTACVRTGDTVSRQGGDEFIIILSEITRPEDAAQVAENVIKALDSPYHLQGHEIVTTTSIGICVYPVSGEDDVQELMKKADSAMYLAKKAGRNRFVLWSE